MACTNCSTKSSSGNVSGGCKSSGSCSTSGCDKLNVYSWLTGMEPNRFNNFNIVEVKFKNTRKEFFKNDHNLDIHPGEPVVVASGNGYDMGVVSMLGELVKRRMNIKNISENSKDIGVILRKPNQAEVEKWQETMKLEQPTMLKARHIANELKLQMKISDVEYQADGTKATFYYTAEDRVDFRSLIRHLADQFKVRIEMRQIGSRQEAGRLGGIGSCGRELCCSTWLTDFRSVSTNAARYQQLSINPQKLAGQCGKLKCCLNFELDSYLDAIKGFPSADTKLNTKKGRAYHFKSDIFKGLMWFSYQGENNKFVVLSTERVHEIIALNKAGEVPSELEDFSDYEEPVVLEPEFGNVVGQDSLTRFDKKSKGKSRNKKRKPNNRAAKSGNKNAPQKASSSEGSEGGKQSASRPNKRRNKKGTSPSVPKGKAPAKKSGKPSEGKQPDVKAQGSGTPKKRPNKRRRPNGGNKPNGDAPKPNTGS